MGDLGSSFTGGKAITLSLKLWLRLGQGLGSGEFILGRGNGISNSSKAHGACKTREKSSLSTRNLQPLTEHREANNLTVTIIYRGRMLC